MSLTHARDIIEEWRNKYNTIRPRSALGGITPEMFLDRFEENVHLTMVQ